MFISSSVVIAVLDICLWSVRKEKHTCILFSQIHGVQTICNAILFSQNSLSIVTETIDECETIDHVLCHDNVQIQLKYC